MESDPDECAIDLIADVNQHPLTDMTYVSACKRTLDEAGVLKLDNFLLPHIIEQIRFEGQQSQSSAYYTTADHTVYLSPRDSNYDELHPKNRMVTTSKGCITTDQIAHNSALHQLYDSAVFKRFLCSVFEEQALFPYADPLSSINLHYAAEGQELGWHYDNSSFAITLLIQKPRHGAEFQYVKNSRCTEAGDMAFEHTGKILDGQVAVKKLSIDEGSLVLFRGRDSIHRVTPTVGSVTRMLVVFAYNSQPDISLSESARMTFYGRLN